MKRLLLFIAITAGVCAAQETIDHTSAGKTAPFRVSEFEPGRCMPFEFYLNSTTGKLRVCNSSSAWDDPVSSVLAGFTPENVANKDTTTALGTSDTKYPSQNAVKTYVDGKFSSVTVSGTACTITAIANGVITAATCTP